MAPFAVLIALLRILVIRLVHRQRDLALAAKHDILRFSGDTDEAFAPAVELAPLRPERHTVGQHHLDVGVGDEKRSCDSVAGLAVDYHLARPRVEGGLQRGGGVFRIPPERRGVDYLLRPK